MTINLTTDQLTSVRKCWNTVQVNNKYHKDQFITRLFSNLLAANGELRQFLNNDLIIREHSLLFNDLLNYLVLYLDNVDRLNQFMTSFFKENSTIVHQIEYLEPMGSALIQTFRQWLGKGVFNQAQEQLWVQIYIHLANSILLFTDDSDNSSIDETESIEEIQGLNINKNVVETPMTPISPPALQQVGEEDEEEEPIDVNMAEYENHRPIDLTKKPSIQVNIRSNDMYKGFRRNDSNIVDVAEPIITPRSPRRSLQSQSLTHLPSQQQFEPIHIPSSPSRISVAPKFNNMKPRVVYDSDEEDANEAKFGFDPRKSKKKSVSKIDLEALRPQVPPKDIFYGSRSSIDEESDDEMNLDVKPTELDITLNPVVSSEVDDNSSSIYNSDHTDNSEPLSHSSNDNSLSLHSYHSGGTDGTEATEAMSHKMNLRSMSSNESMDHSTRIFSAAPTHTSRTTSVSSIEPDLKLQKSIESRQRASLGFMRSSFILKKEIETLGFNRPENVFVKPPTIPAAMASTPNLNTVPETRGSTTTLTKNGSFNNLTSSDEEDQSYDLVNSFMPITEISKSRHHAFTSSCSNLPSIARHSAGHKSTIGFAKHSSSVSNLSMAKHNKYEPMHCVEATASLRPSNKSIGTIMAKKSFKDKLKSFFGASSTNLAAKPTATISSPIETTYSTNSNLAKTKSRTSFSRLSRTSTQTSVDKTRSESKDNFSDMHKFNKRNTRMSSVSDLRSINTMETNDSTSGFSFFSRRNSTDAKTLRGHGKNKYNVTSTPYDVFAKNRLVF